MTAIWRSCFAALAIAGCAWVQSVAETAPTEPVPVVRVQPNYPPSAARKQISGQASVEVTVDDQGKVTDARLLGEDPVGEGFGTVAVIAAKKWRFQAGLPGKYIIRSGFGMETEDRYGTDGRAKSLPARAVPEYPEAARPQKIVADVVLIVFVDRNGQLGSISVLKEDPKGYGFADAAVHAVQFWPFPPDAPGRYKIPFHFEP